MKKLKAPPMKRFKKFIPLIIVIALGFIAWLLSTGKIQIPKSIGESNDSGSPSYYDSVTKQNTSTPNFAKRLTNRHVWKYVSSKTSKKLQDRSAAFAMAVEKLRGSDVFFGVRCDFETKKSRMAIWGPDMDNRTTDAVPAKLVFDGVKVSWPMLTKAMDGRVLLFKDFEELPEIKMHEYMQITLNPNGKERKTFSFGLKNSMVNINKTLDDCRR